jgi:hypothetical protein
MDLDPAPHQSDDNLRIHASIVSVYCPLRLHFEPLKLTDFDCMGDPHPDPAFHSNVDPDLNPAFQNNADQ